MATTVYLDKFAYLYKNVFIINHDQEGANLALSTARNAATAGMVYKDWYYSRFGTGEAGAGRSVGRSILYFDTSGIPTENNILSAKLYFMPISLPDVNFNIVIQNGQPDYPSDGIEAGDYNKTHYSGNYGSVNTSTLSTENYSYIEITDVSIITKGGTTKFILRSSKDIDEDESLFPNMEEYTVSMAIYCTTENKQPYLVITTEETSVTTEAASVPVPVANPAYCEFADGNGTITSSTNATERGFEVKHEYSGDLYGAIMHEMAGFEGDVSLNGTIWEGTLIKTETEEGSFEEGAFTLELGNFPAQFYDQLFAGESYTYRAYAIIDDVTYYGEWVAFSLGVYTGEDYPSPSDDISDGDPCVPIIPIDIDQTEPYPPFE